MLKPEVSLGVGLATAALVWGTYSHFMPDVIDNKTGGYNDPHIASSERQATWTAAAIVGGVSLIAKDPTVFVLGASMVVILAWTHRIANATMPDLTTAMVPASPDVMPTGYEPSVG